MMRQIQNKNVPKVKIDVSGLRNLLKDQNAKNKIDMTKQLAKKTYGVLQRKSNSDFTVPRSVSPLRRSKSLGYGLNLK